MLLIVWRPYMYNWKKIILTIKMENRLPNSNQWIGIIITILYYYRFSFSKVKEFVRAVEYREQFHSMKMLCYDWMWNWLSLIIIIFFWICDGSEIFEFEKIERDFTRSFIPLWILCILQVHFLLSKRFIVFTLNDHTHRAKCTITKSS